MVLFKATEGYVHLPVYMREAFCQIEQLCYYYVLEDIFGRQLCPVSALIYLGEEKLAESLFS